MPKEVDKFNHSIIKGTGISIDDLESKSWRDYYSFIDTEIELKEVKK